MQIDLPTADFEGYIFDLDGTLIDTMPVHYRAWDEAMRRAGLQEPLSEDLFYALGGVPSRRVAELFGERYGLALDPDHVMHEKEALFVQWLAEVRLIEPVVEFARRVATRRPVAVATGALPMVATHSLRVAGLTELFPVVVTAADIAPGRGKPAPDIFLLAAQRLGVTPTRCLVFEDAEPGLAGARAAGMQTVRVPSRTSPPGP